MYSQESYCSSILNIDNVISYLENAIEQEYGVQIQINMCYDICMFSQIVYIIFKNISHSNEIFRIFVHHSYHLKENEVEELRNKIEEIVQKVIKENEPEELKKDSNDPLITMRCKCCGGTLHEVFESINSVGISHRYQCDYCRTEYIKE